MLHTLSPGAVVAHPDHPEWGLGQVQSVIGDRITVNFVHQGKMVINGAVISLDLVTDPGASPSDDMI